MLAIYSQCIHSLSVSFPFSPSQVIELSSYLEKRISSTAESADKAVSEYNEIGKVVTVGDGIARVYGLNKVQAGEVSRGVTVYCTVPTVTPPFVSFNPTWIV